MKFILSPTFAKQDPDTGSYTFDTSFSLHNSSAADFNGCGLIYIRIFDGIKSGKIELNAEIIQAVIDSIERVEAVADEEYKGIFKKLEISLQIS